MSDKRPKIHESHTPYSAFFEVREDLLHNERGEKTYFSSLILRTDAVAVLAKTGEGLWILNREYRHPGGEVLLGCPGGRLEPGEDPRLGGQRELFEETGYWADELEVMGISYPFPGICNQKIYFLGAKGAVKRGEQRLDPFEFIEVELKGDEELKREIRETHRVDGILCAALWYHHNFK